jgi:hypothetical protein
MVTKEHESNLQHIRAAQSSVDPSVAFLLLPNQLFDPYRSRTNSYHIWTSRLSFPTQDPPKTQLILSTPEVPKRLFLDPPNHSSKSGKLITHSRSLDRRNFPSTHKWRCDLRTAGAAGASAQEASLRSQPRSTKQQIIFIYCLRFIFELFLKL